MATAAALPFLLGLLLLAPEQATAAHTPAPPPPTPTSPITLTIDWSKETRRTNTAATVEVDVMPFLARQPATDPVIAGHYGGPFDKYYEALSNLNASFVRFAPWCPNPRLVVPELTPPDCTASKPATNWNSTFFDQIMKDFMEAVCGPDGRRSVTGHPLCRCPRLTPPALLPAAARGECDRLSVIQQLSSEYCNGLSPHCRLTPWLPTQPCRRGCTPAA